jgi:glycosyltransferase involved in cell wall biosynthesis
MRGYLDRARLATLCSRSLKYALPPRPKVNIIPDAAAADPLISVIIPTFNWSQVLKLAIHSVLWQTEQNFELLVIGDGCTDDSEFVVKSIPDGRIRWFNLPVNSGHQSAPNNAGLAMARGKYVALLGHDDIWHPAHLGNMLSAIVSKNADIVSSLVQMIGPAGTNFRMITGVYPQGGYAGAEILPPSGLMPRRAVAEQIGGWKDYRTISRNPDLDFAKRALEAGCRFVSTEELTVFKFNSALRKNSYLEKPCHEQAAYLARIESDRWFMLREALAIARVHFFQLPMRAPAFSSPPNEEAMGWEVSQFRKFRGLE